MADVVIRAEGLSKRYSLGQRERYRLLRDVISEAAARPLARLRNSRSGLNGDGSAHRQSHEWIWALDDVSLK